MFRWLASWMNCAAFCDSSLKSTPRAFARMLMLEGFRDRVLKPLASTGQYGGLFSYTDFTSVPEAAADAFWHDEIHPTEAGFAILAGVMNRDLQNLMPVEKRWAIS